MSDQRDPHTKQDSSQDSSAEQARPEESGTPAGTPVQETAAIRPQGKAILPGLLENKAAARKKTLFPYLFLILIAAYVLFVYQTPYVVFKPGTAEATNPMIEVKGADAEQGKLMLLTVRMSYTNWASYLMARMDKYAEISKKSEVFRQGESEDDYSRRQQYVMSDSQSNAIQAAYKKAKVPYSIDSKGVVVTETADGMPAHEKLKPGDLIVQLDDKKIATQEELFAYFKNKQVGDTVTIHYYRDNKLSQLDLKLAELKAEGTEPKRAGIGIVPADLYKIKPQNQDDQVKMTVEDIGGPSAGLMFSLEIYNQLMPGDITKGYRIAGTGTIDPDGNVGVIGGIKHKVIAANREKAEIFFAPKDLYPQAGETFQPILNYSDAVSRAKEIKTKMKIVPVATMDDALRYLEQLPPKK